MAETGIRPTWTMIGLVYLNCAAEVSQYRDMP